MSGARSVILIVVFIKNPFQLLLDTALALCTPQIDIPSWQPSYTPPEGEVSRLPPQPT